MRKLLELAWTDAARAESIRVRQAHAGAHGGTLSMKAGERSEAAWRASKAAEKAMPTEESHGNMKLAADAMRKANGLLSKAADAHADAAASVRPGKLRQAHRDASDKYAKAAQLCSKAARTMENEASKSGSVRSYGHGVSEESNKVTVHDRRSEAREARAAREGAVVKKGAIGYAVGPKGRDAIGTKTVVKTTPDEHERMRIKTMSKGALGARIGKITTKAKMERFAEALKEAGPEYAILAKYAKNRAMRLADDPVIMVIEEAAGEAFDSDFTQVADGIIVRGMLLQKPGAGKAVTNALRELGLERKAPGTFVGMGHVVIFEYLDGGDTVKITDSNKVDIAMAWSDAAREAALAARRAHASTSKALENHTEEDHDEAARQHEEVSEKFRALGTSERSGDKAQIHESLAEAHRKYDREGIKEVYDMEKDLRLMRKKPKALADEPYEVKITDSNKGDMVMAWSDAAREASIAARRASSAARDTTNRIPGAGATKRWTDASDYAHKVGRTASTAEDHDEAAKAHAETADEHQNKSMESSTRISGMHENAWEDHHRAAKAHRAAAKAIRESGKNESLDSAKLSDEPVVNPLLADADKRKADNTVGSLNSANVSTRSVKEVGFFTPNNDKNVLER